VVYAAGSLSGVMPQLIAASGLPEGSIAPPVYGPAGRMKRRLLAGETADVFASADLAQPRAVARGAGDLVLPFARNRMCLASPEHLGITAETMLDRILAPDLRLATSTPVEDPGGDYARAVFARAEALHPGAEAHLTAKSLLLLGGPGTMAPQPGHSPVATIFLANQADALIYYCSGAPALSREVPGIVSIPLPNTLEVGPIYGLALLSTRPQAARLVLFILSERGQAILKANHFLPLDEAP
jgi:ABC-type molybdate transport system substrate-binding protein